MKSCPQCGYDVRDYAGKCPRCRFSFTKAKESTRRPDVLPPPPVPLASPSNEELAAQGVAQQLPTRPSGQAIVLGALFWGWPLADIVLTMIDGSISDLFAMGFTFLTPLFVLLVIARGAARKRTKWGAVFATLARYAFLCGLYAIWFTPYALISHFYILGDAYGIGDCQRNIPGEILSTLLGLIPLALWFPTSGRAVWKDILKVYPPVARRNRDSNQCV